MQYPFGHGLSYTIFTMSPSLTITPLSTDPITPLPADLPVAPGGNPDLWTPLYRLSTTVTNSGDRPGAAVAQLYLGLPQPSSWEADPTPVKALRGFSKDVLQPGQSCEVHFELTRRDVSYWDVVAQRWRIAGGEVRAMVGFSSREILATGTFRPLG